MPRHVKPVACAFTTTAPRARRLRFLACARYPPCTPDRPCSIPLSRPERRQHPARARADPRGMPRLRDEHRITCANILHKRLCFIEERGSTAMDPADTRTSSAMSGRGPRQSAHLPNLWCGHDSRERWYQGRLDVSREARYGMWYTSKSNLQRCVHSCIGYSLRMERRRS